jgi:hypothetical protein
MKGGMVDRKTLIDRVKKDPQLSSAFEHVIASGVEDSGSVGVGAERFALRPAPKKRVSAR